MTENQPQELTLQDFGSLPARAIVGLAARYARRVLPILRRCAGADDKRGAVARAEAAVQLAEDFARDRIVWLDQFSALGEDVYRAAGEDLGEGQYAAYAAGHAGTAALQAHQLLQRHRTADAMELVAAAWGAYRVILSFVHGPIRRDYSAGETVVATLRGEYDRLVELKLGRFGEAGQPLDATERGPLGPLWPEGAPLGFSAAGE